VVFATTAAQELEVRQMITRLTSEKRWRDPIVTEVYQVSEAQWSGATAEVASTFWPAEAYHQNYFARNPTQGYCVFVVNPKVSKAEATYPALIR
jgi:peptide-methionine (S)-S-oxide reductase